MINKVIKKCQKNIIIFLSKISFLSYSSILSIERMIMMKKIIPFNNVLEFNTDVKEITAISLEHEIKEYPDMISGTFYISGEYKMTEGLLEREKFNFELPFDIALSSNYDLDSLLVDIDDFRYDIISNKNLKVNIDLYIDGETIEKPLERNIYTEELPTKEENIIDLTDEILSSLRENTNDDLLSNLKDNTNEEKKSNETPKVQKEIDAVQEQKQHNIMFFYNKY